MELRKAEEEIRSLTELYESIGHKNTRCNGEEPASSFLSTLELPALQNNRKEVGPDQLSVGSAAVARMNETDSEKQSRTTTTGSTAVDVMNVLDSIRGRMDAFHAIADKFRRRLVERDPVTNQPRYGQQTSQRVTLLLQQYQELCRVLELIFGESVVPATTTTVTSATGNAAGETTLLNHPSLPAAESAAILATAATAATTPSSPSVSSAPLVIRTIRDAASVETEHERLRHEQERLQALADEQARLVEAERILREQLDVAEANARREREAQEALALERAAARRAAQAALEQEAAADRAWVQSIPHRKSLQGVQLQLEVFAQNFGDNGKKLESLTALHTLFAQITAHPEEVNFRRIRRDHPRFVQDIGQYNGGKELLIAAGFDLGVVEEVPSYICREPDVEKDLDGWSAWFDLLKGTVELVDAEMIKR